LKPANILINDGILKIADFGLARILEDVGQTVGAIGTSGYIAPEMNDPQVMATGKYTTKVDVFSLGVILY